MEYLVDNKICQTQRVNTSLVESIEFSFLNDSEVFKTQASHFGSGFKTDNLNLWILLESHLVNTDPYNFIASISNTNMKCRTLVLRYGISFFGYGSNHHKYSTRFQVLDQFGTRIFQNLE